ncbi:uncharacterized protein AB675_1162 [Cyphellophora attinorum]|uniref:N-acetyltransferase domain-containing protein n=1 Tax=Cyphellophora attinorum TaxID=1664694 RepID=A0A0N1NZB6_9EURO|nr:uncharacterized protein AB675_1162 [Phialophora attinorum]KPI38112.1 hypothetical protein AB675_1162 [Phialophora attinorum]
MGRHHSMKLPEHLYLQQLTPPPTPPPPVSALPFASSLLSVRSVVYPPAPSVLFHDAYGARAVISDKIPGFKTSAAFFTTLRANLTIDLDSPIPSCCNTPDLRPTLRPSVNSILPLPSPLAYMADDEYPLEIPSISQPPSNPPPLTTTVVTSEDDKVEVLHLIADSVAQQRQYASSAILWHPLILSSMVALFAYLYKYFYTAGTSISPLLAQQGYIDEAESVGTWKWLDKDRSSDANNTIIGESDDLVLSRFGDIPIGALILRGVRPGRNGSHSRNGSNKSSRRQNSNGRNSPVPITGVIRGWTTKNRYRRKGVGTELLEEAVKICQDRGWQGPEFDADHANSKRMLPGLFNGPFEKRDRQARNLLESVKQEMGVADDRSVSTKKKR